MGLVNRVVPKGDALRAATELAHQLAALYVRCGGERGLLIPHNQRPTRHQTNAGHKPACATIGWRCTWQRRYR